MAHTAADGSKWTNASQARRVPGKKQGDGKQPVSRFSKPEAPRAPTAEAVSQSPSTETAQSSPMESTESVQDPSQVVAEHGPAQHVEINHADGHSIHSTHSDGHKHHSKHASAAEAHMAAQQLSGAQDEQSPMPEGNPAQAMM